MYTPYLILADEDDLRDVMSAVADLAGRWQNLGVSLGIHLGDLEAIISVSANKDRPQCHVNQNEKQIPYSRTVSMCSGHAVAASPEQLCMCLFAAPPGGEVWEADMEETVEDHVGGGGGGGGGGQQPCSCPDSSKRASWWVTITIPPYSISTRVLVPCTLGPLCPLISCMSSRHRLVHTLTTIAPVILSL